MMDQPIRHAAAGNGLFILSNNQVKLESVDDGVTWQLAADIRGARYPVNPYNT